MSLDAPSRLERVREYTKSPGFSKLWRYATVSVISTVVNLGGLYVFFRVLKVGSAVESNIIASAIATIPSYYLNRSWAWGKTGRSHVMKEVVPFWVIAAVSLVLSTIAVGVADREARLHLHSHFLETVAVEMANLLTYGLLWVGKFVLFNKVLFAKPTVVAVASGGTATSGGVPS